VGERRFAERSLDAKYRFHAMCGRDIFDRRGCFVGDIKRVSFQPVGQANASLCAQPVEDRLKQSHSPSLHIAWILRFTGPLAAFAAFRPVLLMAYTDGHGTSGGRGWARPAFAATPSSS